MVDYMTVPSWSISSYLDKANVKLKYFWILYRMSPRSGRLWPAWKLLWRYLNHFRKKILLFWFFSRVNSKLTNQRSSFWLFVYILIKLRIWRDSFSPFQNFYRPLIINFFRNFRLRFWTMCFPLRRLRWWLWLHFRRLWTWSRGIFRKWSDKTLRERIHLEWRLHAMRPSDFISGNKRPVSYDWLYSTIDN